MNMMNWKQLLSPHRLGTDIPGKISPERSPFQRDFDRIVFSGSFRRLQDKTQVFPLSGSTDIHTRLTHSMETSSIARSLGTAAGVFICQENDTDGAHPSDIGAAVAAAALAHDIGNPPLGHAGEEAIRYWFENSPAGQEIKEKMTPAERADFERYDGNAQGFRVLARLEMSDRPGGMQLTCATLGAFAKYPGSSGAHLKKCGFFQQEKELFTTVAESCGMLSDGKECWKRHPLSFLLEAADDIAYLTVDFEDAMRLGLIEYGELEKYFLDIIDTEYSANYVKSLTNSRRKAEFLRAQAIGVLVRSAADEFIRHHDELLNGTLQKSLIDYTEAAEPLNEIFKRSAEVIYTAPRVAEIVAAGFELFSGMLDIFVKACNDIAENGTNASPHSTRLIRLIPDMTSYLDNELWRTRPYVRIITVLDYLSGMSDSYAVSLYKKLKGISL